MRHIFQPKNLFKNFKVDEILALGALSAYFNF